MKKNLLEENESLRKKLEDMEMQLEIYQIEQETQMEKKQNEELQTNGANHFSSSELQLEKDMVFASHLLTEIWRDTVTTTEISESGEMA